MVSHWVQTRDPLFVVPGVYPFHVDGHKCFNLTLFGYFIVILDLFLLAIILHQNKIKIFSDPQAIVGLLLLLLIQSSSI